MSSITRAGVVYTSSGASVACSISGSGSVLVTSGAGATYSFTEICSSHATSGARTTKGSEDESSVMGKWMIPT